MRNINVLLAGESWVSTMNHYKGFDHFSAATYETGAAYLQKALEAAADISFSYMPSHIAAEEFPYTLEELRKYDVVFLSDIGANTLLLSRKVFLEGKPEPNRLRLLQNWVEQGGALCMCGGYLSFAGIGASAKYFRTPIEEILPVSIYTFDDRIEAPEGVEVEIGEPDHPVIKGITGKWPVLLGYQETVLKQDALCLARTSYGHPLIAVRDYGKGRTMIWASDIGPHWCPRTFAEWPGFTTLWQQAVRWLTGV
ncbi:MAG: glutamine amidotransferase [Treponema sp.]|jgi:uncharacterized membrane protein|nr:glutamine amidotransferase [Treponema sp.]